ncbi:MAG: helix-turn-helix domain-containing protein [Spirochaetota bacterium]
MAHFLDILSFVCASHILLFVTLLIIQKKTTPYNIFLLLGTIAYLFFPLAMKYQFPRLLKFLMLVWIVAIPFFFWLLSLELSRQNFRPTRKHWSILVAKLFLSIWSMNPERSFFLLRTSNELERELLRVVPSALFSLVLLGLALYNLYSNLKHDLVESQKKLRFKLLVFSGIFLTVVLLLRLILHGKALEHYFFLVVHSMLLISSYFFAFTSLELKSSLFAKVPSTASEKVDIDRELATQLNQVFEEKKFYREEGLTIRRLAEHMQVPEHHLRRLINGGLGYKNFNEFLNRYRIQEACEILLREKKQDMPIIRIAMDMGYKSLASFNKAFKDLNGMTPSQFRESGKKADGF